MKNSKKGISLIVLIITIIVIIILATAILVSVINNNPISEANKARYESDRDNMQAVFTNTVASIMSKELGAVNVTAGQINTVTTGVSETPGEVVYTVNNAMISANESGKIVFDKGTNNTTTYYTGKKLPIYAAGETKWYVDEEGVISLEVAGVKYGSGEVESGSGSEEETLVAGLYAEDGTFTSWQTLIDNGDLAVENGILRGGKQNQSISDAYYTDIIGKLVIDESVTSIQYCAFGCPMGETSNGLVEVVLPNSLISIEDYAFSACSALKSINIPNSVTNIGNGAFTFTGLTSVIIPSNVTNIGTEAFRCCTNLTSITILDSVATIDCKVFESCNNITSITIDENNSIYDSRNNCNAIIETATNELILGCQNTIIPNGVTSIGDRAFFYCTNLTSIEIPHSVTSIGAYAFSSCTNLESIDIPGSVNTISDYAFSGCSNLSSMNINDGVTSIGNSAFRKCTNLKDIYIPNSVTNISSKDNSEGPFYDCLDTLKIYCGASSKQSGWGSYWNCYKIATLTERK